jgi:hypothetical protein
MLHNLFQRHHLLPSAYYELSRGEQLFLLASEAVYNEPNRTPTPRKGGHR